MTLGALILSVGFPLLVLLGFPFGTALLLTTAAVLLATDISIIVLAQTFISGTQSFSLLAIPFFMLAGEIMSAGGLSRRLVDVASVFVRHLTGGMGHVTVLAAVVFAAISGSAPATTVAVGSIMIPAMAERGYSKAFATALAVSAGVLAPLIPPSIAFVIWGTIAEQSISRLFVSGIFPGLSIALGLHLLCYVHARRHKVPVAAEHASLREMRAAIAEGKWALLMPAIVLGGIYGGVFTPTEAAVVSCVYALLVACLIERTLVPRQLPAIILKAIRPTALVMFIVIASSGFGVLIAQEQLAGKLAQLAATHISQGWLMLLVLNIGFFLLAAVMDEVAIMVILGPVLIAIANRFGIDPIHFGAIIVTNVAIGMAAPPIGYALFVGMAISGLSLGEVSRAIWPMIVVMLVVLMLVTYVPALALGLQQMLR